MKVKYFENGIKVTFRLGQEIKTISGTPLDVWFRVSALTGIKF